MKKIILSVLFANFFFIGEAKNLENLKTENTRTEFPCTKMWLQDVDNLMMDYCATYEQAVVIADRNFEECLEDMYGN